MKRVRGGKKSTHRGLGSSRGHQKEYDLTSVEKLYLSSVQF